jgi:hypothetical protein
MVFGKDSSRLINLDVAPEVIFAKICSAIMASAKSLCLHRVDIGQALCLMTIRCCGDR